MEEQLGAEADRSEPEPELVDGSPSLPRHTDPTGPKALSENESLRDMPEGQGMSEENVQPMSASNPEQEAKRSPKSDTETEPHDAKAILENEGQTEADTKADVS